MSSKIINIPKPPTNKDIPLILGESFYQKDPQRQTTYLHFKFHDKPSGTDQSRPGNIKFKENKSCSVKFEAINHKKKSYSFNGQAKPSSNNECFIWYDSINNVMVLEKIGLIIGPLKWDRDILKQNLISYQSSFQQIQNNTSIRLAALGKKKKKKRKNNNKFVNNEQNNNNDNINKKRKLSPKKVVKNNEVNFELVNNNDINGEIVENNDNNVNCDGNESDNNLFSDESDDIDIMTNYKDKFNKDKLDNKITKRKKIVMKNNNKTEDNGPRPLFDDTSEEEDDSEAEKMMQTINVNKRNVFPGQNINNNNVVNNNNNNNNNNNEKTNDSDAAPLPLSEDDDF